MRFGGKFAEIKKHTDSDVYRKSQTLLGIHHFKVNVSIHFISACFFLSLQQFVLTVIDFAVKTMLFHQLMMCTLFYNLTVTHNKYHVGVDNG